MSDEYWFMDVPFVPAYDLLDQKTGDLSDEEVSAIALALYLALPKNTTSESTWLQIARSEGIAQRF